MNIHCNHTLPFELSLGATVDSLVDTLLLAFLLLIVDLSGRVSSIKLSFQG